jgi:hypothetical protein
MCIPGYLQNMNQNVLQNTLRSILVQSPSLQREVTARYVTYNTGGSYSYRYGSSYGYDSDFSDF